MKRLQTINKAAFLPIYTAFLERQACNYRTLRWQYYMISDIRSSPCNKRQLQFKLVFIKSEQISIPNPRILRKPPLANRSNLDLHHLLTYRATVPWHPHKYSEPLSHNNKIQCTDFDKYENSYLNTVVASCDPAILDLDVGWRVCEFTLGIRPRTFVPLEFPTDFELQPSRIFAIYEVVHINHSHYNYRLCVKFNSQFYIKK